MTWREAHRRRVMDLEHAAAAVMLAALDRILDGVADRFAAVTAAAEDEASLDDLGAISTQWTAAVHDQVLPWFAGVYEGGADAAVAQVLGLGLVVPDADDELLDHAAAQYLAGAEQRFTSLGDEAWTAARAELIAGFRQGEGIGELRARIRKVTDLSRHEADALARTEVISASNMGADARVELMGADAPPYKQWLATMDGRTRPTHRHADGQVVPRGTLFEVGAAHLKVPGDPSGPAAETVNCRCTVLYLDTSTPIDVDTPGRGQGGIVDEVAREVVAAGYVPDSTWSTWKQMLDLSILESQLLAKGDDEGAAEARQKWQALQAAAGMPGPDQVDSTTGEPHTGAMVALVPADPEAWAIEGGEAPESLHLTLAYLGDAADIPEPTMDALVGWLEGMAEALPPIEAQVFGAAVWNTQGDTPSMVLSVGGPWMMSVHLTVWDGIGEAAFDSGWSPPAQHEPWVAHVCLAYGAPELMNPGLAAAMEGPIVFDRLRLGRGGEALDFKLVGAEPVEEDEPDEP